MGECQTAYGFDARGGTLGEDTILWEVKCRYSEEREIVSVSDDPYWDRCCTLWDYAVSEGELRRKVWARWNASPSYVVRPVEIASCTPLRFETPEQAEALRAASRIEARSDETVKHGSARRAKAGKDAQNQDGASHD